MNYVLMLLPALLIGSGFLALGLHWFALFSSVPANRSALLAEIGLTIFATVVIFAVVLWAIRAQLQQRKTGELYDGTQDRYWYGGMFYCNPDDRAIFVPKRAGIGYTLNFAHPASWLLMALSLLPLAYFLYRIHVF